MGDEVSFEVYQNSRGFIALDDIGGVGYGSTANEAIDDLLESYNEVEDVYAFSVEFQPLED